ncbi:MAG: hypothetical protein J0M24_06170 [Verrucomicrobia bacterium]|nr:hypothetical protein [Verrucomicrobiota bacterium]
MGNQSENNYWYRPFPHPINGKRVHYRVRVRGDIQEGIGFFQVQRMKEHESISILHTSAVGSLMEPVFRLLETHTILISPHPNPDVADFLFLETSGRR